MSKPRKQTVTKSVKISDRLDARLRKLADDRDLSDSDILRMAFEAGLPKIEKLFQAAS